MDEKKRVCDGPLCFGIAEWEVEDLCPECGRCVYGAGG